MNPETRLQNLIRASLPANMRLFRNNVGMAYRPDGTPVKYGLCPGSADLIGWTTINGIAVFTAVEVKQPGQSATAEQLNFLAAVRSAGGIAVVASEPEHVMRAIRVWEAQR